MSGYWVVVLDMRRTHCKHNSWVSSSVFNNNIALLRCGYCRLSKNHWRQVIREQSLYSRWEANHSHLCKCQDAEHEARASTSVQYQDARVETRVPAAL